MTDLLDGLVESGRPVAANRVLTAIRKMFNWAIERDIIAIAESVHAAGAYFYADGANFKLGPVSLIIAIPNA